jgi:hypothetical protein
MRDSTTRCPNSASNCLITHSELSWEYDLPFTRTDAPSLHPRLETTFDLQVPYPLRGQPSTELPKSYPSGRSRLVRASLGAPASTMHHRTPSVRARKEDERTRLIWRRCVSIISELALEIFTSVRMPRPSVQVLRNFRIG